MKRKLITALAHPASLRIRAGKPEYHTAEGIEKRRSEGRGTGEGPNYVPWFSVRDFSSSGYRCMVWSPRLHRVIHLFSDLEYKIFLWLERNERYTDIRECYPLDLDVTLKIAAKHGITHPAPYGEPVVMTTDFLVTIQNGAEKWKLAIAVKYEKDLSNPRVIEKLFLEGAYHESQGTAFQVMTENSVPRPVFRNLQFVRGALREGAMRNLQGRLPAIDELLRRHLAKGTIGEACAATDADLDLPGGASMQALRFFVASRHWSVDLRAPIAPEAVLIWEHAK